MLPKHSKYPLTLLVVMLQPAMTAADGVVVSKLYDPYVQPLETEIEWRFVGQNDGRGLDFRKHSLGLARSVSDRWNIEVYAIALQGPGENLVIDTYEIDAKWQLTEQGEYAIDWGILFELEREIEENAWEFSTQLLASRDFGRITTTANFGIVLEWGERIRNEVEATLRLQARYRLRPSFEPAIELHVGQNTTAIGPAITGLARVSRGKKLRWELGLFTGLDSESPDQIVKANIEFEF